MEIKTTPPQKTTGAVVNTGTNDANFVTPKAITDSVIYNTHTGFLLNGKIVPSVASDDLTVAIKGLDGNDPSVTNPVRCRFGDIVRSITSALNVTLLDGTNWCNSGSAYYATKERDYFIYLGYNATDGIVIGFSGSPNGKTYDDFSAVTTNDKYCAISDISNAAASDAYELIGRFAATLSAGAGYTWTVPAFTNKNLIQVPIYEARYLSLNDPNWDVSTFDDGAGGQPTTNDFVHKVMRDRVHIHWKGTGVKAGTAATLYMTSGFIPSFYTYSACTLFISSAGDKFGGGAIGTDGRIYISLSASIADNTAVDHLEIDAIYRY